MKALPKKLLPLIGILSRCAGVKELPNKISGRRPLFLM